MKISNKNARQAVEQTKTFEGNNLFSVVEGGYYKVFSYGFHWILYAKDLSSGQWYENNKKYSVSTSKQASQTRLYDVNYIKLDNEALKNLR